jgi:integrase
MGCSSDSAATERATYMGNPHLRLVTPAIENRTVTPRRAKNSELRTREYLTELEVDALMAAARQNRYGHRDATMILVAFRHGLRAGEAVDLRWDQVDFNRAVLHVRLVRELENRRFYSPLKQT